jgi:hypothetical protein
MGFYFLFILLGVKLDLELGLSVILLGETEIGFVAFHFCLYLFLLDIILLVTLLAFLC